MTQNKLCTSALSVLHAMFGVITLVIISSLSIHAGNRDHLQGMTLDKVSEHWNLNLRQRTLSDRIELVGGTLHIIMVPGLSQAMVGRRTVQLSHPLEFEDGKMLVPSEIIRLLPPVKTIPTREVATFTSSQTIILDPGHGGRDTGAIGCSGIREKDVNLKIALKMRRYLQDRGVKVVMTRSGDSFPSLQCRADIANRTPNSIFISIHANAVANDRSVSGVETFILSSRVSDSYRASKAASHYSIKRESGEWIPRSSQKVELKKISQEARGESSELAQLVQRNLVQSSDQSDRGVKSKNLHVLRESFFSPAILVEVGFLTNPATARKLRSNQYLNRLADGLGKGVEEYLRRNQHNTLASTWQGHSGLTAMKIVRR